ncbi:MAG TPA: ABC transporter substrate-binding protein [Dongiaceae bacterium]|jgi:polar amino acid transport system substrate-binding protein
MHRFTQTAAAAAIAAAMTWALPATAEPPKTIEPGKLTIGINGDMPMTSIKDGKLVGTDGELLAKIAGDLGLEVKPVQMEWSALIQATKQGKVDIMLGSMGWTKERTEIMSLTDPIYYFGTFLLQKKNTNYSTFADISGHKIGTVTGFTLVPELKSIPNVGEVKLYDTSDGVMRDLIAGRIDMAVLDPGLVQYALLQHPEWSLHQVALVPEPDKYPIMSTKYYSIMAIYPEEKELYDAINAEVTKAWANCDNVKTMAKYGLGDKAWFDPPTKDYRNGVDRPADWHAPKSPDSCFSN